MAEEKSAKASPEYFQRLVDSRESFVDDKVCVIGVFGKGSIGYKSKAVHVNSAIDKEVFKIDFLDKSLKRESDQLPCYIEVYHDIEQRIIYLHLVSVYDVPKFIQLCEQAPRDVTSSEAHQYWASLDFYHACTMMFMFSVCHIMVLMHPGQTFDLGYIRLFRTLASTRHQLLSQISQCMYNIDGVQDIWRQTGRPCIPRLICSFRQRAPFMDPSQVAGKGKDTYASKAKGKSLASSPQKKLQHALEDQIYSVMRKARLLGSLSSSSLFTVSSGQAFVHVEPHTTKFDPVDILLNKLARPSISTKWMSNSVLLKGSSFLKRHGEAALDDSNCDASSGGQIFRDYLKQQVDHLMTGDAGRDGVAEGRRGTHVEVPTCRMWARVCKVLFEFFMTPKSEPLSSLTGMASQLDLDMKFSEARCRKVLPVATSAYLEGLPSHYTHNVHLNQLSQAIRIFALHARGPAFEHYAAQLQEECNKIWLNGRQLCEERSLTGRHCVYPYHEVPDVTVQSHERHPDESREKANIPRKPHSSRITSMCACNCGRVQDHREDPFDLMSANCSFFQQLAQGCCSSLNSIRFPCHPSFTQPTKHAKEPEPSIDAPLLEMAVETTTPPSKPDESGGGTQEEAAKELAVEESNAPSLATSEAIEIRRDSVASAGDHVTGSHSVSSFYSGIGYQSTFDASAQEGPEFKSVTSVGIPGDMSLVESQDAVSVHDAHMHSGEAAVKSPWQRQNKDRAFLEAMLTNESPTGVFPRFPSWSLCRLGNASCYSTLKGLEQPGFFPSSNFLLSWDIPVLNESQSDLTSQFDGQGAQFGAKVSTEEAWPTLNEVPSSAVSGSTLPLYQALSYARQQCASFKGQNPPLVSSTKGSTPGSSRQRGKGPRDGGPPTVRAYLGDEYECPRGHRFICSGPDKMVKATSSGHVKETAHKLVTMDMPLYFPCPCRSSKPLLAQLMRIFVVTPDSPVQLTVNPRVQPAAPPCPVFHPGIKTGITLPPGSFCVLRFPYVYVTEDGPILPPADSQPLLTCRVLKGVFSVMGKDK